MTHLNRFANSISPVQPHLILKAQKHGNINRDLCIDLIGTFAFAVYGAYVAMTKKSDVFGILDECD